RPMRLGGPASRTQSPAPGDDTRSTRAARWARSFSRWPGTKTASQGPARVAASGLFLKLAGPQPRSVIGRPARSRDDRQLRVGRGERHTAARDDAERDAVRRPEVTRDRPLQRQLGDVVVAREVALEVRRVAEKDVVRVQLIGLSAEAADRLQPEDELRLGLHPAPLDFVIGRTLVREPRDFLEDRVL